MSAESTTGETARRERYAKALRGHYPSVDTRPSYRAADAVLIVADEETEELRRELIQNWYWKGLAKKNEAAVDRVRKLCDEMEMHCSAQRLDTPSWVESVRAALRGGEDQ